MLVEVLVVLIEIIFLVSAFCVVCVSIKETYLLRNLRLNLKALLLFRLVLVLPTLICMIYERLVALERQTFTYDYTTQAFTFVVNKAEEVWININMVINGSVSIWFTLSLSSLITDKNRIFQQSSLVFIWIFFIVNMFIYGDVFYFFKPGLTYGLSAVVWGVIIFNDFTVLKILSTINMDESRRRELIRNVRISYRAASFFYVAMGVAFFSLLALDIISVASVAVAILALVMAIYYANSTKVFLYLDHVHVFIDPTLKIESNDDTQMKSYAVKTVPDLTNPGSTSIREVAPVINENQVQTKIENAK